MGRWPSENEWARYLRDVADELSFDRLEGHVVGVRPADGSWCVDLGNLELEAPTVVIATGMAWNGSE